MVSKLMKVSDF